MSLLNGKKIVGPFVALLIVVLFAQDATALSFRKKARQNSTTSHPWSFQMALDESLDEDKYHGFRLSLARQYSPTTAIRFNLGFEGRDVNRGITRIHFADGYTFAYNGAVSDPDVFIDFHRLHPADGNAIINVMPV